jgi:hypothetical protein
MNQVAKRQKENKKEKATENNQAYREDDPKDFLKNPILQPAGLKDVNNNPEFTIEEAPMSLATASRIANITQENEGKDETRREDEEYNRSNI